LSFAVKVGADFRFEIGIATGNKETLGSYRNIWYIVLMDILLDASAIMAIILNEPNKKIAIKLTKGSILLSPVMISYE
jgi:hypothetical protein